jgi:hypothetical protein
MRRRGSKMSGGLDVLRTGPAKGEIFVGLSYQA